MRSKQAVADGMAKEHRYLQNVMFQVCMEYIKVLATNCEREYYDPRNEYACIMSKNIVDLCKEKDYWI